MLVLKEILDLYNAAEAAYDNGQYASSAQFYERASELAQTCDDEEIANRYAVMMRRDVVHSFMGLERLREALAALAPLTETVKQQRMRSCCIYGTFSDQISIAHDLPVSLPTLEKAFAQAEEYYRSAGNPDWRSKIMHLRARLFLSRGMLDEALASAQEGWTLWQDGCPAFFGITHLRTLFDICLARRDAAGAQKYLDQWEALERPRSRVRESGGHVMRSRLARLKGRPGEALDHARRAVQVIEIADWCEPRYEAVAALVRALLLSGQHESARQRLLSLMRMRRSESGHDRYAIALLRGDYHLARARVAARLDQADDEFDRQPTLFSQGSGGKAPGFELTKARRAYQSALREGRWIDKQLRCTFRQREIQERLARTN